MDRRGAERQRKQRLKQNSATSAPLPLCGKNERQKRRLELGSYSGASNRKRRSEEKVTSGAEVRACALKHSFSVLDAVWDGCGRGFPALELRNSAIELINSVTEKVFSVIEKVFSVAEKVSSVAEKVFSGLQIPSPSRKRYFP